MEQREGDVSAHPHKDLLTFRKSLQQGIGTLRAAGISGLVSERIAIWGDAYGGAAQFGVQHLIPAPPLNFAGYAVMRLNGQADVIEHLGKLVAWCNEQLSAKEPLSSGGSEGSEGNGPAANQGDTAKTTPGATPGQGEGGDAKSKQPERIPIPNNEAQQIVRDYIKKREDAGENITARHVSEACGIALGRVPAIPAWQAYQARKKRPPQAGKRKEARQLTKKMLDAIGKESDPSANLDAEEAAWRYLLENAKTKEERARLNGMTAKEKAEAIQLVIDQFADQDKTQKLP